MGMKVIVLGQGSGNREFPDSSAARAWVKAERDRGNEAARLWFLDFKYHESLWDKFLLMKGPRYLIALLAILLGWASAVAFPIAVIWYGYGYWPKNITAIVWINFFALVVTMGIKLLDYVVGWIEDGD